MSQNMNADTIKDDEETIAPQDGMETNAQQDGMETIAPQDGMETIAPQDGMETITPQDGMETIAPQDGMETISPQDGMETIAPQDGMETIAPQDGMEVDDDDQTQDPDTTTGTQVEGGVFSGRTFMLFGFEEEHLPVLTSFIKENGGKALQLNVRGIPDYAIVPIDGYPVDKTVNSIVTNVWLQMCIEQNQLLPERSNALFTPLEIQVDNLPLKDCVISISGYTGVERDCLMRIGDILGARTQEYFVRKAKEGLLPSTHLVVNAPEGLKYDAAVKWKIPAVTKSWIIACARTGNREKEDNYLTVNGDQNESTCRLVEPSDRTVEAINQRNQSSIQTIQSKHFLPNEDQSRTAAQRESEKNSTNVSSKSDQNKGAVRANRTATSEGDYQEFSTMGDTDALMCEMSTVSNTKGGDTANSDMRNKGSDTLRTSRSETMTKANDEFSEMGDTEVMIHELSSVEHGRNNITRKSDKETSNSKSGTNFDRASANVQQIEEMDTGTPTVTIKPRQSLGRKQVLEKQSASQKENVSGSGRSTPVQNRVRRKQKTQEVKVKTIPYNLRERLATNYMDLEVPDDDTHIYCEECNKEYDQDCPIHGALDNTDSEGGDAKSASVGAGAAKPPPPPAAGGPPPPPPLPPPVMDVSEPSGGEPDARAALFADLNKGEGVTSGLKKVTDDMETHKNPALHATSQVPGVRAGPAPFKAPSSGPKTAPKQNKVAAPAAAKPPVLELQQKKWIVLEPEKTKGDKRFNMTVPEITEEREHDLEVLQMRKAFDPKRFYKSSDTKRFYKSSDTKVAPKDFQRAHTSDNKADSNTGDPNNRATGDPNNRATGDPNNRGTGDPNNRGTGDTNKEPDINLIQPMQDDKRLPVQDDRLPVQDDERLLVQDGERLPMQDHKRLPVQDDRLPVQDEERLPVQDEERLPVQDEERLPMQDDERLPVQDDERLPVQDDERLPVQDDERLSVRTHRKRSSNEVAVEVEEVEGEREGKNKESKKKKDKVCVTNQDMDVLSKTKTTSARYDSNGNENESANVCCLCKELRKLAFASSYCIECGENLCEMCKKIHLVSKLSKHHNVIDRQTKVDISKYTHCFCENENVLEFYCEKDNVFLCVTCYLLHIKHCKHVLEIKQISAHQESTRENLTKLIDDTLNFSQFMEKIKDTLNTLKASEKNESAVLISHLCEIRTKIHQLFEHFECSILSQHTKLLKENREHRSYVSSQLRESRHMLKNNLSMIDELVDVGSDSQLFVASLKMNQELEEHERLVMEQCKSFKSNVFRITASKNLSELLSMNLNNTDGLAKVESNECSLALPLYSQQKK